MSVFNDFWQRLDQRARIGLAVGVILIVIATFVLGAWTLRTEYQVLFADLSPQDAATMVAELDRSKTPYRLSGNGNTILVPADLVYRTRLKLVGQELPLHGAVGFELFNNSEVGMTEFAQRVNYQRALQGELTRTILSIDEVQTARVHLVLPEQGLFKKNATQAKASITLALKPGRTLSPNQVQGIQRLVGASVPAIRPEDVTIVDQHGVAMTRRVSGGQDEDAGAAAADSLDDKRAIESYLGKKVNEVLERAVGSGQGMASVDVSLNPDYTKVTTEDVVPGNTGQNGVATGVVVRERHHARDPGDGDASHNGANQSSREIDYQVGRRVEQVVTKAGAVSQINVAVVVRHPLNQVQIDHIKELVAAAAGLSKSRGDAIAVYSMEQLTTSGSPDAATVAAGAASAASVAADDDAVTAKPRAVADAGWIAAHRELLFAAAAAAIAAIVLLGRRKSAEASTIATIGTREREQLLAQVHAWLDAAPAKTMERNG